MRSKGVGGVRARQASPRALAIAGGMVLAIVIAIVLGVVLSGGGGGGSGVVNSSDLDGLPPTGSQSWAGSLPGAAEANALFKGVPQHGLTLGDPKAKTEMEMFIDVQCPVCQDYEVNHLPSVVKNYIAKGKVQLQLKPWAFLGPQSTTGRLGVIAAGDQNKAYEYAKILYDNQGTEETGWLTGRQMALIAASVNGLNLKKWQQSANGSAVKQIASTVDRLAAKAKVQGTPTVLVGCAGNTLQNVTSPQLEPTLEQTQNAIAAASCTK